MSEAKSGKTASVAILSADVASLIRATILCKPLPHDARRKPRLAPRRLDVLLQEAVRFLAGIAGPGIGPGAAFVVGGAGGLAGVVAAVAALEIKTLVVAAEAVDRGFDCLVAPFDHAGAAHAGDTAIALHPRRHVALEPAHRAFDQVGRIAEGPGTAAAVALAHQRAFRRIARDHRRTEVVTAGTVEIGLRQRRTRGYGRRRQKGERHHTRPEQANSPHARLLSSTRLQRGMAFLRKAVPPQPFDQGMISSEN